MRKSYLPLVLISAASAVPAMAEVVYSNLPSPIPPNVVSQCYECAEAFEIGQGVQLQGNVGANLASASILMSNWALESTYETVGTSAGYDVPLTLNLYQVGPNDSVGALIATTGPVNQFIAWRPEDGGCADPTAYLAADGNCYHGLAQTVTFNLNGIAVPSQFIWGLALNTTDYGYSPTHVAGPYDSLNVGLNTTSAPSVGSDLVANSAYWNTTYAPYYADGGAGGIGTFRLDPGGWAGQDPAASFDSTPEPALLVVLGLGMAGLAGARYKFRKNVA
jgi:hypothetical protein